MIREQAVIKLPSTEIPLIALDDWRVWLLVIILVVLIWKWLSKKNG